MSSNKTNDTILGDLFPTYIYWGGFIFTTIGMIYSIQSNRAWLALFGCLPLLIGITHVSIRFRDRAHDAEFALRREQNSKVVLEQTAAKQAELKLAALERTLYRGSLEQSIEVFQSLSNYIARVQSLQKARATELNVRHIFNAGFNLFFAVNLKQEALEFVRQDDPFILFLKRSKMNHKVASLKIHQINSTEGTIFLTVNTVVDQSLIDNLRALAESTEIKGLKDFFIVPAIEISMFDNHNMQEMGTVLQKLKQRIITPIDL